MATDPLKPGPGSLSLHPLNLALRLLLEAAALAALAYWGWSPPHTGLLSVLLAIASPVIAAVLWTTFRVPGDPGDAPVAVSGSSRLILELGIFIAAITLLAQAKQPTLAILLSVLVLVHYAASYDRIRWLLSLR